MEIALVDSKLPENETLTSADLLDWLRREVTDVHKAAELRIGDVTEIATAYALGEMTAEEANKRFHRYGRRWGEALPGIASSEGMTNEQIIKTMDEERENPVTRWNAQEKKWERETRGSKGESGGFSR